MTGARHKIAVTVTFRKYLIKLTRASGRHLSVKQTLLRGNKNANQMQQICCIWLAFYFHVLTTIHGQTHIKRRLYSLRSHRFTNIKGKVRVKFTLEQATKGRGVEGGVEVQFYTFFNPGTRWGGCQRYAPRALPSGRTRYPLYMRLGGPQGRFGRVRKISPTLGFDPRNVQPVASRYTD